jgi:hypothetical protein
MSDIKDQPSPSIGGKILSVLVNSHKKILGIPQEPTPEPKPEPRLSHSDVMIKISKKKLQSFVNNSSLDNLIMGPTSDVDQIHNLNALLLAHRNSIRIDSKCFEHMHNYAVWLNTWISRLIHIIGFTTLILAGVGVTHATNLQPYIMATGTFLFGINGYKDHGQLESGVEALDQCVSFANELHTDINYFLYRSNHSVDALNVFVSAIDDKLKIFDRTTRIPIPLSVKNKILDIHPSIVQKLSDLNIPISIYNPKRTRTKSTSVSTL